MTVLLSFSACILGPILIAGGSWHLSESRNLNVRLAGLALLMIGAIVTMIGMEVFLEGAL